jgi:hypothetical protein
MRKRQAKVFDGKIRTMYWQALHDIIKVQVGTTDRHGNALVHVCDKPRDLTETLQDASQGNKVFFEWRNEDSRIVGV